MSRELHWVVEDHVCRKCGGRILRCVSNVITGGGNPLWRCADCGEQTSGMTPACLCWCGYKQRCQTISGYTCVHRREGEMNENMRIAMSKCGFDIRKGGEVGIALEVDVERIRNEKCE